MQHLPTPSNLQEEQEEEEEEQEEEEDRPVLSSSSSSSHPLLGAHNGRGHRGFALNKQEEEGCSLLSPAPPHP
jgi:hypothetical protein